MSYDVVLADPPWQYYGSGTKMGAAAKEYPLMSDDELIDFDMRSWMNLPGVLFMWATGPRLDFAFELIDNWGLFYRGMAFVWVKTKLDGVTPIGAQGVRPSIVKPTTEFVLAATRAVSNKGRPLPLSSEKIRQVVMAPKQEHSRKPDEVHERIEEMYPDASKIELFARRKRAGWDVWGNDAGIR